MEENLLLLRKIDLNHCSDYNISSKISEAFENSDTYFRRTIKGNKIIIGKKLPKSQEEELKHRIALIKSTNSKKSHSKDCLSTVESKPGVMMKSISLPLLIKNQNTTHSTMNNDTKQQITDAELNQLFDNFKLKKEENSKKNNDDFINQFPHEQFKQLLRFQEETLKKREQQNQITNNINQHIQSKINKPPNTLLLNRIAAFRSIKEIKNKTEEKTANEITSEAKWNMSLRYEKDFIGVKKGYMNIGTRKKPKWMLINDQFPKVVERVRNGSEKESPEHQSFLSNPYLKEKREYDSIKRSFNDLQGLSITGKGLLELELENVKKIKGKKKIIRHKMNQEAVQPKEFMNNLTLKNICNIKTIHNCRNLDQ